MILKYNRLFGFSSLVFPILNISMLFFPKQAALALHLER